MQILTYLVIRFMEDIREQNKVEEQVGQLVRGKKSFFLVKWHKKMNITRKTWYFPIVFCLFPNLKPKHIQCDDDPYHISFCFL